MDYTPPFRFCPSCGSNRLQGNGERRLSCPDCGFVFYLNVGAAAAILLLNPRNELLLIRRAKDPGKGLLGVPGGFVDPGEPIETALRREMKEEVNLEIEAIDFLASFPNDYPFGGVIYPTLDLYFTGRVSSFEQALALDEVEELVIRPVDSIADDEVAFESFRRALRFYRDLNSS